MCICCRQMKPQKELLRVVKPKDGEVVIDTTGKVQGRGSYICLSKDCINKAKKTKAFDRVYKTKVDDNVYLELERIVLNAEN